MKVHFIKQTLLLLAGIAVTATGCLKDDAFENGAIQSMHSNGAVPKVIEIKLTAGNASNFLALAVTNSDKDTVMDLVPINLATADPAPEDLHVTIALDAALVDNYNTDNETNYAIPDPSMYSIDSLVITIPKGSHTGYVKIKFKPSDFLGGDWALGFRIASIQEKGYIISGNLNTGITSIAVKNIYDGVYSVTGTFSDITNAAFTGYYPKEISLVTQSSNSNAYLDANVLGTYGYVFDTGGGLSYYGNWAPVFVFDDNGNVVDVVNYYGQPSSNGRAGKLDPSGVNKYDPATKTLEVSYYMVQNGSNRCHFTEKFVYKGQR